MEDMRNEKESIPELPESSTESLDRAEASNKELEELQNESTIGENLKINMKALAKRAETYELEKFKKNHMLILNHMHVNGCESRIGTEKDVEALKITFEKYGFEVDIRNDRTHTEIQGILKELSKKDFTDYGCVAVAVLTHGAEQGLIRAKDKTYNESEIIKHFKVDLRPTLVTKPKIVIIQACRGEEEIETVTVFKEKGKTKKDFDDKNKEKPYTLPVEADMLVCHSSYFGKPSLRDDKNGSWFIQSICRKIEELAATHDFESIMVEVKRQVAIDHCEVERNTTTDQIEINKQMPVITSTLIRKLYLRKYGEPPVLVRDYIPPLTPQISQCPCFIDHFDYMKTCLSYYLDEHPGDNAAQSLYDMVKVFDDRPEYNEIKKEMLKDISDHLRSDRAREYQFQKFVHFFNSGQFTN
ncbi:unnamed protein product [Diatraea saccharalis]|uniref:Uncharacterized protein n=1 Tax=Diatraea saccharalis TaxID=40085 RepID=A0A9N9RB16_9NEOP|nr:unnamed protein product [Diatraea saccharalis]